MVGSTTPWLDLSCRSVNDGYQLPSFVLFGAKAEATWATVSTSQANVLNEMIDETIYLMNLFPMLDPSDSAPLPPLNIYSYSSQV